MKTFHFDTQQVVASTIEDVFAFHADAFNLERMTPPWLNFRLVTPRPIVMGVGTIIDYELRLHGIRLRWQSEITAWDPPFRFVDEQRKGPYRQWIHTHEFVPQGGETIVRDSVAYAVPGGALVQRLFVAPDVQRIFAYRGTRLTELLGVTQ